jgi:hypothetical protein
LILKLYKKFFLCHFTYLSGQHLGWEFQKENLFIGSE